MLDLNFVYKQKKHVRQMQVLDTVSNWEFKYNDFFIISITPMSQAWIKEEGLS
jgi:hypothetical protein